MSNDIRNWAPDDTRNWTPGSLGGLSR
jgi:hypothetical protein